MKAIITGGTGFIGSHLVERLAELGHEVTVLDAFPPASPYKLPNISWSWGDITQGIYAAHCDWMFHLAAKTDIIPSIERPVEYHVVNVDGTVRMLDAAVQLGVKRFIYASSTSIYGIPKEYPTPETAPADPQFPYALTKYVAEQYVMHWGRVYRLPVVSLRITTAYGPAMKSKGYGSVFKVFMTQKANGAPFTVVGDGSQSRDFIYISDVVDAFIKAAEADVKGEVFNIGFGQPRTIKELLRLLGSDNAVYLPKRPGEPDMTWADIAKAKSMLNWEPRIPLEQGVKVMLEHLPEWKNEKVWTPESIEAATKKWFQNLG